VRERPTRLAKRRHRKSGRCAQGGERNVVTTNRTALDRLLPKWLSTSRELADAMAAIGWRRPASAAWFADRDR